ncbi:hypothetical protein [Microbacterium indicum]|uniref:hypothetical protein n=1 Tax=Microbacterium indicum TaxID=358100 RepID=UPI0012EB16F4|nr:hypothetical protein [Microbacterium indicum]
MELEVQLQPGVGVRRLLHAVGEGDLGLLRERMLTDYIYRLTSARLADEQARAGGSAHLFLIGEAGGSIASHAVDVPALMGLHLPDQGPEQDRRDDEITRIVVDFVTGEPLGWPAWGPEGDARGVGELRAPAAETFRTALARWEGVARP